MTDTASYDFPASLFALGWRLSQLSTDPDRSSELYRSTFLTVGGGAVELVAVGAGSVSRVRFDVDDDREPSTVLIRDHDLRLSGLLAFGDKLEKRSGGEDAERVAISVSSTPSPIGLASSLSARVELGEREAVSVSVSGRQVPDLATALGPVPDGGLSSFVVSEPASIVLGKAPKLLDGPVSVEVGPSVLRFTPRDPLPVEWVAAAIL